MDTNLAKLLKPLISHLQSKTNNADELLTSLTELILGLIKENSTLYLDTIRILLEEKIHYCTIALTTFQLLTKRIKEVYDIEVDIVKLREEAENSLKKEWPGLSKQIFEYLDIANKIDDILKHNK
ncbi:MAG: hypothetical protein NTW64_01755 [Candidatus Omnitrophica bacterium]|nr:hypothetical protein [Candidatus Omnitrophota bacterium]